MKLSPEQLLDTVHGALYSSIDENGALSFHRFNEHQMQVLKNHPHGDFTPRAIASSGVRLCFESDASALKVDYTFFEATSRRYGSFAVYCDGTPLFEKQLLWIDEANTLCSFSTPLPAGDHRIEIYLPWTFKVEIHGVELTDATYVAPVEYGRRWLAIGDSITQGYTAFHTENSYVSRVTRALGFETLNLGIGGYVFDKNFVSDNGFCPDVITVALGTNDFSRIPEKENLCKVATEFLEALTGLYPDTPIYGILPIWRGDKKVTSTGYTIDDWRKDLAAIYRSFPHCAVIDGDKAVPHRADCFQMDLLHPNDEGFVHYAALVQKTLENE